MGLERRLGLRDEETLLSVVRRAPVTMVLPLGLAALLLFAPVVLLVPLLRLGWYGQAVIAVSLVAAIAIGLRAVLNRQASFLAVTDQRIILVRQYGTFDRHVTELPYSRIQRVSYRVKGFYATLFRYGSLVVESAGGDDPLTVELVPYPARVQDLINQLQSGRQDGFGDLLQAVSRLDARQLALLKAEVDRSSKHLSPDTRS
ncbi:MAG: PH domain-containing protein [Patescibacteria group bacterium]|nr:MAG: PH domain-containing protein [Patescibacteria group bacterium]